MKQTVRWPHARAHAWLAVVALILASSLAQAFTEVDGIFGLTPAGPDNYVAVEISHGLGQALAELSWYHNECARQSLGKGKAMTGS